MQPQNEEFQIKLIKEEEEDEDEEYLCKKAGSPLARHLNGTSSVFNCLIIKITAKGKANKQN